MLTSFKINQKSTQWHLITLDLPFTSVIRISHELSLICVKSSWLSLKSQPFEPTIMVGPLNRICTYDCVNVEICPRAGLIDSNPLCALLFRRYRIWSAHVFIRRIYATQKKIHLPCPLVRYRQAGPNIQV